MSVCSGRRGEAPAVSQTCCAFVLKLSRGVRRLSAVRTEYAAGLPLGLVALVASAHANAQPAIRQPIRLEYLSDESCPRAEDFQAMVLGRTQKAIFVETRARTARVEMHVDGTRAWQSSG
jgi:hypothetical protein